MLLQEFRQPVLPWSYPQHDQIFFLLEQSPATPDQGPSHVEPLGHRRRHSAAWGRQIQDSTLQKQGLVWVGSQGMGLYLLNYQTDTYGTLSSSHEAS